MISKILIPTDFSTCAESAVKYGLQLADELGAEALILHVQPTPDLAPPDASLPEVEGILHGYRDVLAQRNAASRAALERLCRQAELGAAVTCDIVDGVPYQTILDRAESDGYDMIIIGTHGRGALKRLLLGSTAERVVRAALCPVLTIRAD